MKHFEHTQAIYHRNEVSEIADYLMSHQTALRDEFLGTFSSLKEAVENQAAVTLDRVDYKDSPPNFVKSKLPGSDEFVTSIESWRNVSFKYQHRSAGLFQHLEEDKIKRYPTACKIIQELGDDCPIANYSCLRPNTVIHRHTGPENRSGEFLRLHIPLIIPKGDIFLEVNGEEVTWNNLFGFNNQFVHSAHNYTNEYRLIFLIDVRRTRIGLQPGKEYNKLMEIFAKPFVRQPK
jgi:hypothetical protein